MSARAAAIGVGLAALATTAMASTRPAWDALPEGVIPLRPVEASEPRTIPAAESVDGLLVQGEGGRAIVTSPDRRCLLGGLPPSRVTVDADERPTNALSITPKGVDSIRTERLFVADGKASLEIADVWVDATSHGARIAARTVLPLAKLATGPEGFVVYGMRQGTTLHAIVPAPYSMMFLDRRGTFVSSSCAHAHVALDTADGGATTELVGAVDFTPKMRRPTPSSPTEIVAEVKNGPAKVPRSLDVVVSASRMSRDAAPLVSVVLGWTDDEPAVAPPPPDVPRQELLRD